MVATSKTEPQKEESKEKENTCSNKAWISELANLLTWSTSVFVLLEAK